MTEDTGAGGDMNLDAERRVEPTTIGSPDGAPPLGSAASVPAVVSAGLGSPCVSSADGLVVCVPQAASTRVSRMATMVCETEGRCIGRFLSL